MIATFPAMPTSAVQEPGQRSSAGASSAWNRPVPRKNAPYAHQNSQWELTKARWIHPAASDRRPEASTAADHRTPRVRWPATTRSGVAAVPATAQDRPRRVDVLRRRGALFLAAFFLAAGFFATVFLAAGFFFACVLALVLCLTLTLRFGLAFLLTLLPRTLTFGAAAAAAG